MSVMNSFGAGIKRASGEKKMVFLLWIFNFMFASAVYLLVSSYLGKALGNSDATETLLKKFDFGIFLEMMVHNGKPILSIVLAAACLGALYFWIVVFLNGGILSVLTYSHKTAGLDGKMPRLALLFFQGAGKYFGRFFRLTVYSLLLWIVLPFFYIVATVVTKPFTADGLNEKVIFYSIVIKVVISLFLFFLIRMILDYARIAIVTEDSRYVFRALFRSVGFVFRKPGRTLGLYYVLLLAGAIIFVVFWILNKVIPTDSYFPIMLSFLAGQIFILSRGWLKIAFQAAQLRFYSMKRT